MSEISIAAMRGSKLLQRLDRMIYALPKAGIVAGILILQGLIVCADYMTGPYVPFGLFYLWSLFLAIKYVDSRTAYIMAFLIVAIKTYVRYLNVPSDVQWWQFGWQFTSSYTIYTTFCYLLNSQLVARKHAEATAVTAVKRAREAERKLYNVSEETQQRIGRELHDDLGQHLTGAAFMSQVLSKRLKGAGREEATDAERLTVMLNEAISKTRSLSHGLSPEEITEQGLQKMMERFSGHIESVYRVRCVFSAYRDCRVDDHEVAVHLFRITQEAVNNAIKHGAATWITLALSCNASVLRLEISDNGCGFDINRADSRAGLGLRSMRYRADIIGATLSIAARREGGTRITIEI